MTGHQLVMEWLELCEGLTLSPDESYLLAATIDKALIHARMDQLEKDTKDTLEFLDRRTK